MKKSRSPKVKILLIAAIALALIMLIVLILFFPSKLEWLLPGVNRIPMLSSPFKFCDLDHNKVCDDIDDLIFKDTFGKCRGDPNYNFEADFDGDGCVVTADEKVFNESKQQEYPSP